MRFCIENNVIIMMMIIRRTIIIIFTNRNQACKKNKTIVLCPKRDPRLVLVPLWNTSSNTMCTFPKAWGMHCTTPENSDIDEPQVLANSERSPLFLGEQ